MKAKTWLIVLLMLCVLALPTVAGAETVESGTCGANVTWTLDDQSTLTISGTGATDDYGVSGTVSPFANRIITHVIVEEGVTGLGEYLFYNNSYMQSIALPASLTSIGYYAFSGCSNLAEVSFNGTEEEWLAVMVDSGNGDLLRLAPYGDAIVESGTCGANVTWTLSRNLTLTISGTGNTEDYSLSSGGTAPFSNKEINQAIIEDGVTGIGAGLFYYCSALNSVTIADSVTSIGFGAFAYCNKLTDITIPSSVTSIGQSAFACCTKLTHITIPEGVTCINESTFENCYVLTQATIPEGVTSIGDLAFSGCALTSITIPESVTSIGYNAFSGCAFTSVTIPASVASIGNCAFSSCSNLTSITISEGVISIGDHAFYGCPATSIWIPASVTSIGPSFCDRVMNINVSAENSAYQSIGGVLYSKDGTRLVLYPSVRTDAEYIFPAGVTSIGEYAFEDAKLTSITIPESVTTIGSHAFSDCINLAEITIPESVTNIGDGAFEGCNSLTSMTIPSGVTAIGQWFFENCYNLTDVVILEGVTSIDNFAFNGCINLTSITIPRSMTSIGMNAFPSGCRSLTNVYYTGTEDEWNAITIGEGNELLKMKAPYGPDIVASGTCGNSVSWTLDRSATLVISGTGATDDYFAYSGEISPFNSNNHYIRHVVVEEGVTGLGDYLFTSSDCIISVSLPVSVTSIGADAFSGTCLADVEYAGTEAQWNAIVIGNGNGVLTSNSPFGINGTCGLNATWKLTKDGVLTISGSGQTNDYAAYSGDVSPFPGYVIYQVIIEEGVTGLGEYLFSNCQFITSVTLPESLTRVGYCAFSGCNSLEEVLYTGTREKWNAISIENGNDVLIQNAPFDPAGSCGANVNWVLSKDGTLTISGTGAMDDYHATDTQAEWYRYREFIQHIIIEDGVTSIGGNAFYDCHQLTSISIPDSVTSIGDYAFLSCADMTAITIPNSVTSIGVSAFYGCAGLTEVTIPDSVTNFGVATFVYCSGLTNVTLPSNMTRIVSSMFSECTSLETITIPESVTSIEGTAFYHCVSLTGITIPEGVVSLDWYTFSHCSGLTSITIPASMENLGTAAFGGCTSLTSIDVAGENQQYCSVDGIVMNASQTELVVYPAGRYGEYTIPDGVTRIADGAFSGCVGLTGITIPDSVTSIGTFAFQDCCSLTNISIPDSVTSISSYSFAYCSSLTDISLPDSVNDILSCAFRGTGITSFTIPDSATCIEDGVFSECNNLISVTIPEGVTSIGNGTFCWCPNLVSISLPEGVTSIDYSAFSSSGLKNISIPRSMTIIMDGAFNSCDYLTDVYYAGTEEEWNAIDIRSSNEQLTGANIHFNSSGSEIMESGTCGNNLTWTLTNDGTLTISGSGAMDDYSISGEASPFQNRQDIYQVIIEDGVTSIGDDAFYGCSGMVHVEIPDSVTRIGYEAFNLSGLISITIPNSVTAINSSAFINCNGLTSIAIPDSVTSLGSSVLSNCPNLISVSLPSGLTAIPNYAFTSCTSLNDITIPDSVTYIGDSAFAQSGLTSIAIPYGVTIIDSYAFAYCTGLTSLTIPGSVVDIGIYAFAHCSGLTDVILSDGVTSIGGGFFSYCGSLTSITIPSTVTFIGGNAFENCVSLAEVNYTGTEEEWNAITIEEGNELLKMKVPYGPDIIASGTCGNYVNWSLYRDATLVISGIGAMDDYSLSGNVSPFSYPTFYFYHAIIEEGVTSLGEYLFYNCDKLNTVSIPVSVTSIGFNAFVGCSGLTDVYYAGTADEWNAITIDDSNTPLNYVTIHYNSTYTPGIVDSGTCGDNVTWTLDNKGTLTISGVGPTYDYEYSRASFSNLSPFSGSFYQVIIEDGVTGIGAGLFFDRSSLNSVTIADSVTSIGAGAFLGCENLTDITIPNGLISIDWYAICGTGLTEITLPDSVAFIGGGALSQNHNLTYIDVSAENSAFCSVNGVLMNKDCTEIVQYPSGRSGEYSVPAGVNAIGSYAFCGCNGLTGITLPDSVTTIGESAFSNCIGLTSLTLPDSITSIDYNAFNYCTSLTSLTIPGSVAEIGFYAFANCSGLTDVILSDGVTSISAGGFSYCGSLTSITIPSTVTYIGRNAFGNCVSLAEVNYTGTEEEWNAITIEEGNELLKMKVPYGPDILDSGTCGNNVNWSLYRDATLVISGTGATDDYSYSGESSPFSEKMFYQLVVEDGVTGLGELLFPYCECIHSVTIPLSVTSIGNEAFYGCTGLTDVYYDGTLADWIAIEIQTGNESLTNAALHLSEPWADVAIDAANFPDEELRSYVASETVDWNQDGILSAEEALAVTRLDFASVAVTDMTGIEHFPALQVLSCNNAELTWLDVSHNPALQSLNCGSNQLTSLDVSHNPALTSLTCSSNQLTSLDVSHNTALSVLSCGGNQLTTLDVSHNTALSVLSCGGNQLTTLDVSNNTALTDLNCNANQLTTLDVSNNTALTYLYCENNQLTTLDVSLNTALMYLSCGSNQLTTVDVSLNTALTYLHCAENQLTTLDVSNNPALTTLYCFGDGLTSLDVSNNPALTILNCSTNSLTSLDVSNNPALTTLYCSTNQLTVLDLSNNTQITDLRCAYNQLTSLDLSMLSLDNGNSVGSAGTSSESYGGNIRAVVAENGRFDLSTLPFFDVTKASNWTGGTVEDTILTVEQSGDVTYAYDCGIEEIVTFTLSVTVTEGPQTCAHENTMVELVLAPTDTEPGTKRIVCAACGEVLWTETIPALSAMNVLRLPASLSGIEDEAFACAACEAVIIPEGCTSIGSRAFANCPNLIYVRIPASVTSIADDAFDGSDQAVLDRRTE